MIFISRKKEGGLLPASKTEISCSDSRPFATGSLLGNDVLCILHFSQNRLGVILEFVRIRGFVNEVLKVISSVLILGLVPSAIQCQSCSQVRIGIVRSLGQNLLICGERFFTGAYIK